MNELVLQQKAARLVRRCASANSNVPHSLRAPRVCIAPQSKCVKFHGPITKVAWRPSLQAARSSALPCVACEFYARHDARGHAHLDLVCSCCSVYCRSAPRAVLSSSCACSERCS